MESIKFTGIPDFHARALVEAFNLISEGKRRGTIDEQALERLLGKLIGEKFITTKAEADFWLKQWQANPDIETPWDFGSWVDAFTNAEIELKELKLSPDGSGEILFEQLAWPSGGISAMEQIIKVFGGTVVSNSAI